MLHVKKNQMIQIRLDDVGVEDKVQIGFKISDRKGNFTWICIRCDVLH